MYLFLCICIIFIAYLSGFIFNVNSLSLFGFIFDVNSLCIILVSHVIQHILLYLHSYLFFNYGDLRKLPRRSCNFFLHVSIELKCWKISYEFIKWIRIRNKYSTIIFQDHLGHFWISGHNCGALKKVWFEHLFISSFKNTRFRS